MRLALKITAVITIWTIVVLGFQSERRRQREFELLEAGLRTDQHLIGATIRPSLIDTYESRGVDAAKRVIMRADASEGEIRMRWVEVPGSEHDPDSRPDVDLQEVTEAIANGREIVVNVSAGTAAASGDDRVYTYMPLPLSDRPGVALELMETFHMIDAFTDRLIDDLRVNVLIIGTVGALLAVGVGFLLIGSRVESLVGVTQAVGRGEYPTPRRSRVLRRDELVTLAEELERMVDLLRTSRDRESKAAEIRDRAVAELRHADRLATVGLLMARVAHDIGTPLNVIAARSKRIARGQVEGDEARENARIAAEQADRIAAAVRGFLEYARRPSSTIGEHAIGPLMADLDHVLRALALDHVLSLSVAPEAATARVRCEPSQVQQALANLVVNAAHASPRGNTIEVRAAMGAAPPREDSPDDGPRQGDHRPWIHLEVSDRGRGMGTALLARVREPFFTTKPPGEGTGLGLPIVAGIVDELRGQLTIESEEGKGTTVRISLPTV